MNPDPSLRVRRGNAKDADGLARLRYEFRSRRAEAIESEAEFVARYASWVRHHLTDHGPWRTWLVENDDGPQGNVWLQIVDKLPNPGQEKERHGYLTNFFVRESLRGQGVGSRLLAALLEECVALDLDSIFLWPTDQSRPLYGRHGFHPATNMMILER